MKVGRTTDEALLVRIVLETSEKKEACLAERGLLGPVKLRLENDIREAVWMLRPQIERRGTFHNSSREGRTRED